MKKRIILTALLSTLIASIMWISAAAETEGDFEYTLNGDEATITDFTRTDAAIAVVPDTVGGDKTVVAIGDEAFKDHADLANITIPNGVALIGVDAFSGTDENLVLTCPDWNVPVMEYALANGIASTADNINISKTGVLSRISGQYYNGSVAHLVIPQGVVETTDNDFYGGSFTSVTIPNSMRTLGYGTFYNSDLESVSVPSGVLTIAGDVFGQCDSLTSVDIPETVISIGDKAFRICYSLTNITVHEENPNYSANGGMLLNKAGSVLLQYPSARDLFVTPEGITSIAKNCFYQSSRITDAVISEGVMTIGESAFSSCSNLKSIYLSSTVNQLGSSAFYGNDALKDIIVANDTININTYSFYSADGIENVWCNEGSNADNFFGAKAKRPLSITNMPDAALVGDNVDLDYELEEGFVTCGAFVTSDISWASSNTNVATINSTTGELECVGSGTTDITVQRADGLKAVETLAIPPTITGITEDTGYSDNDCVTSDTIIEITGKAEPNSTIELWQGAPAGILTTANSNGDFVLQIDAATFNSGIENETTTFTVVANNSLSSDPFDITFDTMIPTVSATPANGSTDLGLFPTATLTFDEPVRRYYTGEDLSSSFLNGINSDDNRDNDIFDIDSVVQSRDVPCTWTSSDDRTIFTVKPDIPLFPGIEYEINMTRVEDDAGNITTATTSNFTTVAAPDFTEDDIQLMTTATGISFSKNDNVVSLDAIDFDLTDPEIIAEMEALKGNSVAYGNSKNYSTDLGEKYACLVLRVYADAEYDNVYISDWLTSEEWQRQGTVDVLGGNTEGKSYVDLYMAIAYKNEDNWQKTGGMRDRAYTIVFANADGSAFYSGNFTYTLIHDSNEPEDPDYTINEEYISSLNEDAVSFTFSSAEVGTTCYYTISDEDDNTEDITGSALVASEDMTVSDIDVSDLSDGELLFEVRLKDSAGNFSETSNCRMDKHTARPTASILSYEESPTYAASIYMAVQFSDNVTGLETSDIHITNGSVDYFQGSRKDYTFEVIPIDTTTASTITISIPEDVCIDEYGNPNSESASFSISYIPNEAPSVILPIDDVDNADVGTELVIDLADHFSDDDGDDLNYSFQCRLGYYECDALGALTGSVWSFTPTEEELGETYTITFSVTDNKASRPTTESFDITIIDRVEITAEKTDVSSYGGNDGSIIVTATKGNGTYEYSKDNGATWQDENTFSELTADTYQMKARDKAYISNESAVLEVTVGQPSAPSNNNNSSNDSSSSSSSGSNDDDEEEENPVDTAIDVGQKNEEGKIVGSIKVDEPTSDGAYQQEIPKDFFGDGDKIIEVETPDGTVALPDDMFEDLPQEDVAVNIKQVSSDELPGGLKELFKDKPIIDINIEANGEKVQWENKKVEVKVSIPYTPTASELSSPHKIIAVFIDDEGHLRPITSTNYNSETGMMEFTTNHFSQYGIYYSDKTFNDINNYPWAEEAIEALAARGIINGVAENEFAPQKKISRADFVVLVARFLQLEGNIENNFEDVMANTYYHDSVAIAKDLGIITGTGGNTFRPFDLISRQDMMTIICRSLSITGQKDNIARKTTKTIANFKDNQDVSSYAAESVEFLIQSGIVNGNGDSINPEDYTTRAEVAALLYKLLKANQ